MSLDFYLVCSMCLAYWYPSRVSQVDLVKELSRQPGPCFAKRDGQPTGASGAGPRAPDQAF